MFKYGMLYRGFSPMCQPMQGLIERQDDTSGKYFDILVYDRKLTEQEVKNYELEEITMGIYKVIFVGGDRDGETLFEAATRHDAIQWVYAHEEEYEQEPGFLGTAIINPNGDQEVDY